MRSERNRAKTLLSVTSRVVGQGRQIVPFLRPLDVNDQPMLYLGWLQRQKKRLDFMEKAEKGENFEEKRNYRNTLEAVKRPLWVPSSYNDNSSAPNPS